MTMMMMMLFNHSFTAGVLAYSRPKVLSRVTSSGPMHSTAGDGKSFLQISHDRVNCYRRLS